MKNFAKVLLGLGVAIFIAACGSSGSGTSSEVQNEASGTSCQITQNTTDETVFRLSCSNLDGISNVNARIYVDGDEKVLNFDHMIKEFDHEIITNSTDSVITFEVYVADAVIQKEFVLPDPVTSGPIASSGGASFVATNIKNPTAINAVEKICFKKYETNGEPTDYARFFSLHANGVCITPVSDPDTEAPVLTMTEHTVTDTGTPGIEVVDYADYVSDNKTSDADLRIEVTTPNSEVAASNTGASVRFERIAGGAGDEVVGFVFVDEAGNKSAELVQTIRGLDTI